MKREVQSRISVPSLPADLSAAGILRRIYSQRTARYLGSRDDLVVARGLPLTIVGEEGTTAQVAP